MTRAEAWRSHSSTKTWSSEAAFSRRMMVRTGLGLCSDIRTRASSTSFWRRGESMIKVINHLNNLIFIHITMCYIQVTKTTRGGW